jgi:dimethylhistidine N-methyltransferase
MLAKISERPALAGDVRRGLLRRPKSLPPKLFYDEVGSELFERITRLPEYYPTRTETAILQAFADDIAEAVGPVVSLVELGAGISLKTTILIAALRQRQPDFSFFPVDISEAALHSGRRLLEREFPGLRHLPVTVDYTRNLSFLRKVPAPRLVLFLGSTIGNYVPSRAVAFLSRVRRALQPGDTLLLGTDLRKSPEILLPAYDDSQGVTAAFNKNLLARINRELGGHFDLDRFRHVVRWNARASRIEMYLESQGTQSVRIELLHTDVEFEAGESIHTENSYKYTDTMIEAMLHGSGFARRRTWTDPRGWFADHVARVL